MTQKQDKLVGASGEPDGFPVALLTQPIGARQEYFEQQCLIEHPRLREALDQILQTVCPPGDGATMRRPGTMVLVIGPPRVGKTTRIRLLEEQLLAQAIGQRERDPGFIPFASITTAGPAALTGGPITGRYYEDYKIHLLMARLPEFGNASCEKRWSLPCFIAGPSRSLWMKRTIWRRPPAVGTFRIILIS